MGWSLLPRQYSVEVVNGLTTMDILDIHCKKSGFKSKDLGISHIPGNGNYSWTFNTSIVKSISYECKLTWPNHGHLSFTAFEDNKIFVDDYCGGRHCSWKATDGGIYLYNIKHRNFTFMTTWVN
ncbi:S-protein homolog 1-like [Chenopodium quinoa]|uniref:S-protein homolog 1-like n=1 Tax=Chenopodium quinoa TaxID=63459 RepID=UPI000B7747FE|nr:S-protein homolog 1-like [Chenopodium quinoa]